MNITSIDIWTRFSDELRGFACVHWCPKHSLQIGSATEGKARYHNLEVSLNDMLLR